MPNIPPVLLGLLALIAAAALFFILPTLLSGGIGGPGGSGSPTGQPSATAPSSPTAPPSPTPQTYTVQSGDTLTSIATQFGVSIDQIRAANPQITDPDSLQIGDVVTIPPPGSPTLSPSDSLSPVP